MSMAKEWSMNETTYKLGNSSLPVIEKIHRRSWSNDMKYPGVDTVWMAGKLQRTCVVFLPDDLRIRLV